MTQRQPLDVLIDLAREARDDAGKLLADERRTQQHTAKQIEALGLYRTEYAQRMQQAMYGGIDPATLYNYQQFLASLDTAISRARQSLEEQQQRVMASQQHWQQQQRKLSSYDTLATRRRWQEQQQEHRRELRLSDEITANAMARRLSDETHSPF